MVLELHEQVGVVLHEGEEAEVALRAMGEGVEEGLQIWKEAGHQTSMGVVVEEEEHQTLVGVGVVVELRVEFLAKEVVLVEEEKLRDKKALVVVEAPKIHTEEVGVRVGVGVAKLHF